MRPFVCALALLLFATALPTLGRTGDTPEKLADVKLGTYLAGPNFTADDLKGRHVLVVDWLAHEQTLVPYIAYITTLAEKYAKNKLVVIAVQTHTNTDEAVKKDWAKHAKNDRVMVTNRAAPKKTQGNAVALAVHGKFRVAIYDGTGKRVWSERPGRMDEVIGELLAGKKVLSAKQKQMVTEKRVLGRYWPSPALQIRGINAQYFKREIDQINQSTGTRAFPLRSLQREINRPTDSAKTAEAQAIMKQIGVWAKTQHYYIKEISRKDSARAYFMATNLDVMLQQDEMAKPSSRLARNLYSGPKTRMQINGQQQLDRAMLLADYIGLTADPKHAAANPWNKTAIEQTLPQLLAKIRKDYPGTKAAEQAMKLSKQWGLTE